MENKSHIEGLSIIIPAAGRVALLERLLQSVCVARAGLDVPSEVLVLDNSDIPERERVAELAARYEASYFVGSDNLSIKRNQGIELARHALVLFLDSDCTIDPALLREHYAAYNSPKVIGCLGTLEFMGEDNFIWRAVQSTGVLASFNLPQLEDTVAWGPTANISFRREALQYVGGFDQEFSRPGGEDVDLGFRLQNGVDVIVCNPRARAFHTKDTWSSFGQIARRFWNYGRADGVLIRKHPERTVLDLPTPVHFLLLVILFAGAICLARSEPRFLLMPVAWIAVMLLSYGFISSRMNGRARHFSAILEKSIGLIMLSILDFGRYSSGLEPGQARALYRRVLFFEEQQQFDWPEVAATQLAALMGIAVVVVGASLFVTFS